MQDAWVSFIRDPYKGLTNFGWPVYNPNSEYISRAGRIHVTLLANYGIGSTLVELFTNNSATAKFVDPAKYDQFCPF